MFTGKVFFGYTQLDNVIPVSMKVRNENVTLAVQAHL